MELTKETLSQSLFINNMVERKKEIHFNGNGEKECPIAFYKGKIVRVLSLKDDPKITMVTIKNTLSGKTSTHGLGELDTIDTIFKRVAEYK